MKIILILFLLINPVNDFNKIAEVNALKKEAKAAYTMGDFDQAVLKYEKLVNEYGVKDDNIILNLANAYYKNENPEKAVELYASLYESTINDISSAAYNQTGLIAHQQKKKEEAINYFKEALKENPSNEKARFNYTKLKKEIEEEQKNEENKENKENKEDKNQNKQEQENKENKDGESEEESEDKKEENKGGEEEENKKEEGKENEGEEEQQPPQPSTKDKLQEMNMSEEKAQMILEAMKNNEIQYIQQSKKKPQSRADDGKPDW